MSFSNKLFAFIFFTFLSLSVFCQQKQLDFNGDVTDVRVVRSVEQHPDASTLAIPHIAEWKPKHLVIAYEAGIPGKLDMADIISIVSTNDGDTWGNPVYIFNHREKYGMQQYAYANPILFKPPGQNILWCFAMRNPLSQPNSEESFLVGAYSGDGGRSWNQVELTMHYTGSLVLTGNIQRIVENGEPVYLLPAHRNSLDNGPVGGARVHFVLRSKSLLDWDVAGYVPNPEKVWVHEGHIALGKQDGELIMVMRTADNTNKALTPPRAWSTLSVDNGRNWSIPKEEPELYNSVSEAGFGRSSDGLFYYIYNDGPAWSRMALRYKVKSLDGQWSNERTFFDANIHNSYPSLIEISPNDFRAVWDSGSKEKGRQKICFGKFRILFGK
ncbi:sialidase family protein [Runella sp.]|jgi:hypothetical protein|uniref:sialidase family protein n=1 Tax=Runella sp. TaxID=1960881 RepID=UPI002602B1D7|nr:sialidase family protein [Runella sp.]